MLKLGKSKVTVSRHNSTPAMAVDMVPLQKDGKVIWDDRDKLYLLMLLLLNGMDIIKREDVFVDIK